MEILQTRTEVTENVFTGMPFFVVLGDFDLIYSVMNVNYESENIIQFFTLKNSVCFRI